MAEVITSVGATGRDYADLDLWQAGQKLANGADLVARGDIEIPECYDDGASVGRPGLTLLIEGWTTDADNYVLIRAAAGERHDGTTRIGDATGNGCWITTANIAIGPAMDVSQEATVIDDLRFYQDLAWNRPALEFENSPADRTCHCDRVLVHGDGTAASIAARSGAGGSGGDITVICRGTLCLGAGGIGFVVVALASAGTNTLRVVNGWADGHASNISLLQIGAGAAALDLVNYVSTNVSTAHIATVLGTITKTGKANAQDATGSDLLPDDDPAYPSFDDREIVVDPANPTVVPAIIKLSGSDQDVRTSPETDNVCSDRGSPEAVMAGISDIDGVAFGVDKRNMSIGPFDVRRFKDRITYSSLDVVPSVAGTPDIVPSLSGSLDIVPSVAGTPDVGG